MADYIKPLPIPSPDSQPFWDALTDHRLSVQNCGACGEHRFPPSALCPQCGSSDHDWVDVQGKGTIVSFVTFHRLYHPGWDGELPYVVAIVELAEGPRLYANITGILVDDVKCDMPVEAIFDDVTDQVTLLKFRVV